MYDSSEIHLQECKYISVSVQGASVSLWSKSSCQHKAYSSQIWFQRCFCCCINPLFVLNLTYPHSCSYPPPPTPTPLFGERVQALVENWPDPSRVRTLGWSPWWGLTLPPNLKRCSVFICDWRENVGSFASVGLWHRWLRRTRRYHMDTHKPEMCVLLNMKQVSSRPNDWYKEKENKKAGKRSPGFCLPVTIVFWCF